jgi:hypothetical protein
MPMRSLIPLIPLELWSLGKPTPTIADKREEVGHISRPDSPNVPISGGGESRKPISVRRRADTVCVSTSVALSDAIRYSTIGRHLWRIVRYCDE